jgi:hypothetical protein
MPDSLSAKCLRGDLNDNTAAE